MLESPLSNHWKEGTTKGAMFIDRNPELFHITLNYVRIGIVTQYLPADENQQKQLLRRFRAEAKYYPLNQLEEDITVAIAQAAAQPAPPRLYVTSI